jgi:hypothetical protein
MSTTSREMPELELALLRRGVEEIAAVCDRCERCRRTALIGEQVHEYASGIVLCELCRALERSQPVASRTVHGPEFGHTLRILDRRGARAGP